MAIGRLGGDNLSELSANYQPPADKTDTDNNDPNMPVKQVEQTVVKRCMFPEMGVFAPPSPLFKKV